MAEKDSLILLSNVQSRRTEQFEPITLLNKIEFLSKEMHMLEDILQRQNNLVIIRQGKCDENALAVYNRIH